MSKYLRAKKLNSKINKLENDIADTNLVFVEDLKGNKLVKLVYSDNDEGLNFSTEDNGQQYIGVKFGDISHDDFSSGYSHKDFIWLDRKG